MPTTKCYFSTSIDYIAVVCGRGPSGWSEGTANVSVHSIFDRGPSGWSGGTADVVVHSFVSWSALPGGRGEGDALPSHITTLV